MTRIITVVGKRWFQKTYGNTYHSVSVSVDGVSIGNSGIQYGYDDQYQQTALAMLQEAGVYPDNGEPESLRKFAQDAGDKLECYVSDVARERDLK